MPFENVNISSSESTDWAYARNRRTVLMSTSAEWVQACSSCPLTADGLEFITPNRDYPYEGLCVFQDGENWKFIDAMALAIRGRHGRLLRLEPVAGDSEHSNKDAREDAGIEVNPWEAVYHYRTANLPDDAFANLAVRVSYRLHSAADPLKGASGEMSVSFPGISESVRSELVLTIQPLLDIRHVFGSADFGHYNPRATGPNRISLQSRNRHLTFQARAGRITQLHPPSIVNWHYKLGTGQRQEGTNGKGAPSTLFTSETKDIAAFFRVEWDVVDSPAAITLYFHCSMNENDAPQTFEEFEAISQMSLKMDQESADEIETRFSKRIEAADPDLASAILGRIAGVTKFKVAVQGNHSYVALIPTAGAWWFKTPWFRDIFESFLSSFDVLMQIRGEGPNMGRVIQAALCSKHKQTGLIPNRFPEHKGAEALYNSSDATLLCFMTAARYCEKKDREDAGEIAVATLDAFFRVWKTFSREYKPDEIEDGPPRIHASGLLLSTPHHSWVDTRNLGVNYRGQELNGLPSRVSPQFVMDLCDGPLHSDEVAAYLSTPRFFLPEINAQWILVLRGVTSCLCHLAQEIKPLTEEQLNICTQEAPALLRKATENFENVFWNSGKGCLYNAVFEESVSAEGTLRESAVCDGIESEASVVAAVLLKETVFSPEHLKKIWETTQAKLLVNRRLVRYQLEKYGSEPLPFGIVVKNSDSSIYYDDAQYHSDVIWPRSTPYLLRLLFLLNEDKMAEQIIINNLDHQMSEGAIFYNHELFSKPLGNNPEGEEATKGNPVPVKNAIQFWSQWCDPIIELFGRQNPNGQRTEETNG